MGGRSTAYRRFWQAVSDIPPFKPKMGLKNPGVAVSDDTWNPADVETLLAAIRGLVSVGPAAAPEQTARKPGD